MYKSTYTTLNRTPYRSRLGSFAVLVNANARGVNDQTIERMAQLIPARDLFCSTSLEDSEAMVHTMVERGYEAIFACGGDGSVTHLLNTLRAELPDARQQPAVGVLRLGTGNALASHLQTGTALGDLELLAHGAQVERRRMMMIESEGQLFPFAGCGIDAAVLNDYEGLKKSFKGTPMARLMSGLQGYLIAGIGKTVPDLLRNNRRRAFVINEGPTAYRVNEHGNVLGAYEAGEVMFNGEIDMASVGSIPLYGYGMKMFPHAELRPGFFQLRVVRMNPVMCVARLPKIWNGRVGERHGVNDFIAQRVRIELDGEIPFQTSGDAAGTRREVTFRSAPRTFEFVRPVERAHAPLAEPHPAERILSNLGIAA